MDFWEVINRRHSVREYDVSADVSDKQVETILSAAIEAPSAGNCQPWSFIVVRDLAIRRGLVEAVFGQAFLAQAPMVIVACCEPSRSAARYGRRGMNLYCLQDEVRMGVMLEGYVEYTRSQAFHRLGKIGCFAFSRNF